MFLCGATRCIVKRWWLFLAMVRFKRFVVGQLRSSPPPAAPPLRPSRSRKELVPRTWNGERMNLVFVLLSHPPKQGLVTTSHFATLLRSGFSAKLLSFAWFFGVAGLRCFGRVCLDDTVAQRAVQPSRAVCGTLLFRRLLRRAVFVVGGFRSRFCACGVFGRYRAFLAALHSAF
jgi:hypothetical protein